MGAGLPGDLLSGLLAVFCLKWADYVLIVTVKVTFIIVESAVKEELMSWTPGHSRLGLAS